MAPVTANRKRAGAKRWILPIAALLIATAFVLPPLIGINRLQRQIADSISRGIGRPVRMSSVKMRLLPRPGFEIEDFVIEEEPSFGYEPVLRCAQVTAYIRLLSLWRGRLEIARIAFDEPSLNLVRNGQGKWNFDSLLSQAAQIPKAPTAQRHAGSLLRFPYIDANNARVNFKYGDEKKPFSFVNADLAVWLENPGEWRIQFAAQPVRTDLSLDLANTGIFRLEGSLRRAPVLSEMSATLHAEWSRAPLGQLSRIFTGSDSGWRGEIETDASITGSAEHASLKITATGSGIHRAEFEPREPLNVSATCQAQFSRLGRLFDAITCLMPTGDGHLLLTGSVHGIAERPDPALSLEVNHLPVAMAFNGLRLFRSGFAPAIQPSGTIDGNFIYAPAASPFVLLHGQASISGAALVAPGFEEPIALPVLHLSMDEALAEGPRRADRSQLKHVPSLQESSLLLEPFAIGTPAALTISGVFNRSSFTVRAQGQPHIDQLFALGHEFGLLRNRNVIFAPKGTADVDMNVRGNWLRQVADPDHPTAPVALSGSLRLHNATVTGSFLTQPLQIPSAQAIFGDNRVEWSAPFISYGPVHGDGTLTYPAFCETTAECARSFTFHMASLDAATAQSALLGGAQHGELVEELLDRIDGRRHSWPAMTGTIEIGILSIENMAVHDVAASLAIDEQSVQIKSLTGKTLDGLADISGNIEMANGSPNYLIEAHLNHASAAAAAAVFGEKWGPGAIDLQSKLRFSGFSTKQLVSSLGGSCHWDWENGGLAVEAAAIPTLNSLDRVPVKRTVLGQFDRWTGDGVIASERISIEKSEVIRASETSELTGTISFNRELHLTLPQTASADQVGPVQITGTLQHPLVNAAGSTASATTIP